MRKKSIVRSASKLALSRAVTRERLVQSGLVGKKLEGKKDPNLKLLQQVLASPLYAKKTVAPKGIDRQTVRKLVGA